MFSSSYSKNTHGRTSKNGKYLEASDTLSGILHLVHHLQSTLPPFRSLIEQIGSSLLHSANLSFHSSQTADSALKSSQGAIVASNGCH